MAGKGEQKTPTKKTITKKTTTTSKPSSTPTTTKTSYNGSFVTVNPTVDYQSKINEAVAKGDYNAASAYEAARNAKIEYMNSMGTNTGGYTTTTNHVKVYDKAPTNNQGGTTYESAYKGVADLPTGWKTANTNLGVLSNDGGNISQGGRVIGNELNTKTGELSFTNPELAKRYAVEQAITSGGLGSIFKNTGKVGDVLQKYVLDAGLVDQGYMKALTSGDVGSWINNQREIARQNQAKVAAAAVVNNNNKQAPNDIPYPEAELVNEGSFETTNSRASEYDNLMNVVNNLRYYSGR